MALASMAPPSIQMSPISQTSEDHGTGYKYGDPAGGEHVAKFNRFIRIEEELRENGGTLAEYPGVRP